ncbi:hypothetical protein J1C54_07830 [Alcanivorax sp. 1008]|nr:hypothetical protein [Alcanivorax sp. 1008]
MSESWVMDSDPQVSGRIFRIATALEKDPEGNTAKYVQRLDDTLGVLAYMSLERCLLFIQVLTRYHPDFITSVSERHFPNDSNQHTWKVTVMSRLNSLARHDILTQVFSDQNFEALFRALANTTSEAAE